MKAILVIDIDDDIRNYGVTVYHYPSRRFVHSMDANLKPLPQKMRADGNDIEEDSYWTGWNDCLDEITGETE